MKSKRIRRKKYRIVKKAVIHNARRQTPEEIDYFKFEPMREHPGFAINRMGDIKATDPTCSVEMWTNSHGYYCVTFCVGINKSIDSVHRAVAKQFLINTYSAGLVVHHLDANKQNNCVDNLIWCTQSENVRHACSKLSNEGIVDIRKMDEAGYSRKEIHEVYCFVSLTTISNIISRRTFRYLE